MKKSLLYIAATLVGAGIFTACDDDFEQAPIADFIPQATQQANIKISELKELFSKDAASYSEQIPTRDDGTHYIVKGRVVSEDSTANFYKKLSIQDETGGLVFSINMNETYKTYRFGQELVIDLTGMYYGAYSGCIQVGGSASPTDGPSRMVKARWENGVEINGLPDPAAVDTLLLTIPELETLRSDPEAARNLEGRIVRFNGLHFQNPGEMLGESSRLNNSRTMIDEKGNKLTLLTAGYGLLWSTRAPSGTGDLVGVITNYTNNSGVSTWQVTVNDLSGFIGFIPFGSVTVDPVGSFDVDFTGGLFPEGWLHMAVTGNKDWFTRNFPEGSDSWYASMSGYNGTAPFDAWLISQPLDPALMTDKVLTFETQVNGYGSATSKLEVFILDNADPQKANKTRLECTLAEPPASGYSSWAQSGTISLAAATGKFFIGWQYTATQDANYATWCVTNIKVK